MLDPDKSHGPRINLTWTIPAEPNGVIKSYTVFYSHDGNTQREISGIDALTYSVDVLGGVTYQFHVKAVTIKPGPSAFLIVDIPEYSEFSFHLKHNRLIFCEYVYYFLNEKKNPEAIHVGSQIYETLHKIYVSITPV